MIWIEILIFLIIVLYAFEGYRRGFMREIFDLVIILVAFFLALKYYEWAASILHNWGLGIQIAKPLGFLFIWVITQSTLYFINWYIFRYVPDIIEQKKVNKFLGLLPGLAKGLVVIAVTLIIVMALPFSGKFKDSLGQSKISGFFINSAAQVENQMQKIFGQLNSLTFYSTPEESEMTKLSFKTDFFDIDPNSEEKMVELINSEREKAGLPPLKIDLKIRDVARAHSMDMVRNGYFSHTNFSGKTPFDRMTEVGINFSRAGENIALAPTYELAEIGFMKSPSHRDNILNPDFGRIGIGIIETEPYGRIITQNFAD